MGGSSNSNSNSFIPKRGSGTRPRRGASRQMYLFTLISYVVFFATMIAAIGVFLYDRYVDGQLVKEVAALNTEMDRFREADMNKVQAFNARLTQTYARLDKNVSLSTIFTALESSTAQTVKLSQLNLTRESDERFVLKAEIETDTFDSSIFQRELLKSNDLIAATVIDGITISTGQAVQGESASEETVAAEPGVSFTAELVVPISSVPFTPNMTSAPTEPETTEPPATTTEEELVEPETESDEVTTEDEETLEADNVIAP